MEGARFTRVVLNREGLRRPFPPDFAGRLKGRTVRALRRRGKYLLADLSSGETLLMHLGMSGSFRVDLDAGARRAAATTRGSPRPRRVSDVVGRVGDLQRSAAVRGHGPGGARAAGAPSGARGDGRRAAGAGVRRRGAGPCLRREDARRSRSRCSINGSSPAWATSTRARRSIAPACRRAAAPRRSRRRQACRRTAPTASPRRSSRCWRRRSHGGAASYRGVALPRLRSRGRTLPHRAL